MALSQKPVPNTTVQGTVKDKSGKPIESATISIITVVNNKAGKPDTLKVQGTTKADGQFSLKVAPSSTMYIDVSMIGYELLTEFLEWTSNSASIDAGSFQLQPEINSLGNVVVTAKKPFMELAVDRRIFNAEASLNSKGGTAVDLMRNIPGLNIDVNGNVQLRNSAPQIFVDGRPTILTLEQIPNDDIERVEVMTNPSSKYDAGSTAGIINIILKKNRRKGMNGNVSAGFGAPELVNAGASINYRQNKINFFASGNYNQSGGIAKSEASRQNKDAGVITDYFNQETETDRQRQFTSGRFGLDYFIDDYHSLSVSQGFVKGEFGSDETQQQQYLDDKQILTQTGQRLSNDQFDFKRSTTQANFRRTWKQPGKEWTADFTYSGGNNGGISNIVNQLYNPSGQPTSNPNVVRNIAAGSSDQYTFQTDYVNPISEDTKLELGARFFKNSSTNKLDVFSLANGQNTKLPLSNNYEFSENVNALYANYSSTLGPKWQYQGGLRLEQSSFKGELKDSGQTFGYDYPGKGSDIWNAIFPSLYLTYQLKEGHDLQFNFSRRIRRARFWEVNPYVDIADPQNIRKGNPELRPEFVNSLEANYNRVYDKGNLLVSAYFRNNTDDITQYSDTISAAELEKLNNAAISPNALMTTFINADRTNRMGLELTWQHKFSDAFDIAPNANLQYRDVKAFVNGMNLSNYGFNMNAELTVNYKILMPSNKFANNLSFQLTGEYEGARVIPQGRQKAQHSVDFAIRKDVLKNNAGTITFNINDVFNTRRFGSITDTENFYQDAYRRWSVRSVRLTLSYRFGNKDLQLFKRNDRGDGDGEG